MGELDAVGPDIDRVVEEYGQLNANRAEGKEPIKVAIIGGGSSGAIRNHLIASLLAAHPEIMLMGDDAVEQMRARDVLGIRPMPELEMSPYCGIDKRGKGEKKRERAYNRKLWGRRNSF